MSRFTPPSRDSAFQLRRPEPIQFKSHLHIECKHTHWIRAKEGSMSLRETVANIKRFNRDSRNLLDENCGLRNGNVIRDSHVHGNTRLLLSSPASPTACHPPSRPDASNPRITLSAGYLWWWGQQTVAREGWHFARYGTSPCLLSFSYSFYSFFLAYDNKNNDYGDEHPAYISE